MLNAKAAKTAIEDVAKILCALCDLCVQTSFFGSSEGAALLRLQELRRVDASRSARRAVGAHQRAGDEQARHTGRESEVERWNLDDETAQRRRTQRQRGEAGDDPAEHDDQRV